MMTIAITQAKTGRSMKIRDSIEPSARRLVAGAAGRRLRRRRAAAARRRDRAHRPGPGCTWPRPSTIDPVAGVEALGRPASWSPTVRSAVDACAARPCCPAPTTNTVALPFGSRETACCGTRIGVGRDRLGEARRARTCPAAAAPRDWGSARAASPCRCSGSTTASANSTRAGQAVVAAVLELQAHRRRRRRRARRRRAGGAARAARRSTAGCRR